MKLGVLDESTLGFLTPFLAVLEALSCEKSKKWLSSGSESDSTLFSSFYFVFYLVFYLELLTLIYTLAVNLALLIFEDVCCFRLSSCISTTLLMRFLYS
jgi:hypothetical protein